MQRFHAIAVSVRRVLARRPWIYWCIVAVCAIAVVQLVGRRIDSADAARRAWSDTVEVWVATVDHAPGDVVQAELRPVPAAVRPAAAADEIDETVVRHPVGIGEIIVTADIAPGDGTGALIPEGWLAVPVDERPSSGAQIGDRVVISTDGFALADEALIVGHHDSATLVAVPEDIAPLVAFAAAEAGVSVLLRR